MSAPESSKWNTSMEWAQMNARTKFVFIGKLCIMLITFGFVFPHVMD